MIDFASLEKSTSAKRKSEARPADLLEFEEVVLHEHGRTTARAVSRSNRWIGAALVAVALLAAVPNGGNLPLAWLALSLVSATLLMIHLGLMWHLAPETRNPLRRHLWIAVPAGLTLVFALLQLVPVGTEAWPDLSQAVRPVSLTLSEGGTLLGALRWAGYIAFFATLLAVVRNPMRQARMMMAIFLGVVAHAVLGLALLSLLGDRSLLGEQSAYLGYATGTFVNRNSFATFLGMGLCLGLAVLRDRASAPRQRVPRHRAGLSPQKIELLALGLMILVIVLALLATASRMGNFASAVGAAVTMVLLDRKEGVAWTRTLLRLLVVFGGVGLALVILYGENLILRSLFSLGDAEGRLELYRQVLPMIRDRWLTGFGFDSFPLAFELYHRPELSPDLVWDKAHNTYLSNFVELGVFAGSLPLIVVGAAFLQAMGNVRRRTRAFAASAAACGATVTVALHSTVDFSLQMAGNVYLFLALMVLGVVRFGQSGSAR